MHLYRVDASNIRRTRSAQLDLQGLRHRLRNLLLGPLAVQLPVHQRAMIPLALILAAALFADHGRRMGAHHSRHQRMRLHRRLYENT